MTYCEAGNLLTGDIPTPRYVSVDKYLELAAEEIDAAVGHLYVTPLTFPVTASVARLVVKQIATYLASGRIILASAAGGSDTEIHAYGQSLLRQGQDALRRIIDGTVVLDGVEQRDDRPGATSGVPLVSNGDPYSMVDEFYKVMTPTGTPLDSRRFGGPYA